MRFVKAVAPPIVCAIVAALIAAFLFIWPTPARASGAWPPIGTEREPPAHNLHYGKRRP